MDRNEVEVHKNAEIEISSHLDRISLVKIVYILLAWSITDLLYGKKISL